MQKVCVDIVCVPSTLFQHHFNDSYLCIEVPEELWVVFGVPDSSGLSDELWMFFFSGAMGTMYGIWCARGALDVFFLSTGQMWVVRGALGGVSGAIGTMYGVWEYHRNSGWFWK